MTHASCIECGNVDVQFQAIGPTQREAILQALHDDVDKLVAEYGGPRSAESVELVEALRQCDELYRQLTAQLNEQGLLTCWPPSPFFSASYVVDEHEQYCSEFVVPICQELLLQIALETPVTTTSMACG